MSAGDLSVYGEWLVQEANGCTCQGSDAHYGHQPGCGYEPLLKVEELTAALKAAGYAVIELPRPDGGTRKDGWDWDAGEDSVYFNPEEERGIPMVMVESSAGEAQIVYTKTPRLLAAALLAAADAAEVTS